MSFHSALEQLKKSKEFKRFKAKNKNAFLFSAFFTLNPKLELETQQLDYFLTRKKVAIFLIDENGKIEFKIDKFNPKGEITALNENIKIDIEKLKGIIKKEIEKKELGEFEITKVIAILQKLNGKQMWNITCLMSSLKILRMHIDCFNAKVLEIKEESIVDFLSFQKGNKK